LSNRNSTIIITLKIEITVNIYHDITF